MLFSKKNNNKSNQGRWSLERRYEKGYIAIDTQGSEGSNFIFRCSELVLCNSQSFLGNFCQVYLPKIAKVVTSTHRRRYQIENRKGLQKQFQTMENTERSIKWSLANETALVTGGTKGIGYDMLLPIILG
jgi:hypothetical protein